MIKKQQLPLIIGFSLPVLMILFVALSIYLPTFFMHPQYNFLYSPESNYGNKVYTVSNGKLAVNPQPTPAFGYPPPTPAPSPQLYIHNVTTNTSTPVSFEQASQLSLDSSKESPDGFTIKRSGSGGGFFPFYWYDRDNNQFYLVKETYSKKQNLKGVNQTYYGDDYFLGWVLP